MEKWKRDKNNHRRNALTIGVPTYQKNTKIPIAARQRAEELGVCVQDYITTLVLRDLKEAKNENFNVINGDSSRNSS